MGRSRASAGAADTSSATTSAGADPPASRGVWYTVRRGDTLSHIAARHGLASWRTIYNASENEEFRRTHPDPNLIFPGDRVFVPNPDRKREPAPTTTRTRFRRIGTGVRLRFIFDNADDNPTNDRELTYLCVSNLVTTDHLPNGFGPDPDGTADRDHFKVEIEDRNERGDSIPADKVTLEVLKPAPEGAAAAEAEDAPAGEGGDAAEAAPAPADSSGYVSFSPPRRLQVECQRVNDEHGNPTHLFRSRYLRLVTDTVDQNANSDQCLLADWDSSEPGLEILDQVVQVEYRRNDGERPKRQIPIGHDRKKIRMAVHVLRRAPRAAPTPGAAPASTDPIVPLNDAQRRVQKWYRRTYAQANLAPRLVVPIDDVDPPRNMAVVSDNSGANARGNANNRLRLFIRGSASGIVYRVQAGDDMARICVDHGIRSWTTIWNHARNAELRSRRGTVPTDLRAGDELFIPADAGRVAVVYRPPAGSTPIRTAQELARRARTAGYSADAFPNRPRPGDPRGSADLLIKESGGALVTLEDEESLDNRQTLTVARVNTARLKVSSNDAAGGFATNNIGSAEQRALVRNYRTATDRIECFVAGQVVYDNDDSHRIRGRAASPKRFRPAAEQPQDPFVRSTYMADMTMNATDNSAAGDSSDRNPFTFPHESGHAVMDVWHTSEAHQLMRIPTSGTNAVDGTKRIYDSAVEFPRMTGVSPFNPNARLRSSGSPVLEDWDAT